MRTELVKISTIKSDILPRRAQNKSKFFSEKQSGQILVVVLAFSAILGAGLISIYNTAQLAVEKRDLVNAADAASYSGATILAQGLNYTSYTNRAILANNALIGQMVSIRSTLSMSEWYWKNTETVWKMIAGIVKLIPYIGAELSTIPTAASKFGEFWGQKIVHPVNILAEVLQASSTAVIGITNNALWLSQQVHMADSIIGFETNMIAIAKANAPEANVDPVMFATAFGPAVTVGSFAAKFTIKKRKSFRTVGNYAFQNKWDPDPNRAENDEYLNYITEINHGLESNAYIGGRNLIPNAMGLWIATGCDLNPSSLAIGAASGVFKPSAGFGGAADQAIQALTVFGSVLSTVANPIMCLFKRHGGAELVQNEDGKFSWVSIDATAFHIPIVNINIPFAGGAVASFTKPSEYGNDIPRSIDYFIKKIKDDGGSMQGGGDPEKAATTQYFGHQKALRPDCVEYLSPGSWHYYTVSTNSRSSGECAVLKPGVPEGYADQGLFGNDLVGTANKIIYSSMPVSANTPLLSGITNTAGTAALNVSNIIGAMNTPNISAPSGPTTQAPPGISGQATAATTAGPVTAAMQAAGASLASWANGARASQGSLTTLAASNSWHSFRIDPTSVLASGLTQSAAGTDGGPSSIEKILLEIGLGAIIDVDALINLMSLKISDGIERPRTKALNKAFHVLADGLPPFFWDVRITDKHLDGAKFGEGQDLIYTDEDPKDYHDRRYNLGPLVYLPLIKKTSSIKTSAKLNIGGSAMGLPDYEEQRSGLRAIGKARVFFREPADFWNVRYKIVKTSSLVLPYWQARNESLSYIDKAGLLALDGISSLAH